MEHVKAVVRDGELCSAGDAAKKGLNIPSPNWQRTNVTPDANNQIELVFYGKAPHNPSYWEFYLTKPTYDDSKPLAYRAVCAVRWQAIQMPQTHYFVLGYENSAPVRVCYRTKSADSSVVC